MFARILVPTDFSPPSEAALAYGRKLAHQYASALLHIAENPFLLAAVDRSPSWNGRTNQRRRSCDTRSRPAST